MSLTFFQSLSAIDTACWVACFWWMHRISKRQDALLKELREQAGRIEEVSNAEHELVREMHPKVASIQSDIAEVNEAVKVKD